MRRLPNLHFRSAAVLCALYAVFAVAVYLLVVYAGLLPERAALAFVAAAGGQFLVGPVVMDLALRYLYRARWVTPPELRPHVRESVEKLCAAQGMRVPRIAIIDDGAPEAFTYGYSPGTARLVLSRGTIELLDPDELEAVIAHELGHAAHWDMVIMTVALFVPLAFSWMYRALEKRANKTKDEKARSGVQALALFCLLVYEVTLRIVLWLSRLREYHADRFAADATGNPNALARALVKIAYGLAARRLPADTSPDAAEASRLEPFAALGIFDRAAAFNLVVSSSTAGSISGGGLDIERCKDAMQWDLWNPWASFYEFGSTHPLVAKRLQALADHARALNQPPFTEFDRTRPESYWDEFFVDAALVALPMTSFVVGLFLVDMSGAGLVYNPMWFAAGVMPLGVFGLLKTLCAYRGSSFPRRRIDALLAQMKVSPVRPVNATLEGTIVGKGVPGLVFSEDFVLRDDSGIVLLDYQQPLHLWNRVFGLLRAQAYQGKRVRVAGWFRRTPVPFLEISRLELLEPSGEVRIARRCYAFHARVAWNLLLAIGGAAVLLYALGYYQMSPPLTPQGWQELENAAENWWHPWSVRVFSLGEVLSQLIATLGIPASVVSMVVALPIAALLFAFGMALVALWDLRFTVRKWLS